MKKHLLLLSFLLGSLIAQAAPRSLSEMMEAAKGVIKAPSATTRGGSARMEVLQQGRQFTVVGYSKGGFAVIANDDRFNAVLGYSDTEFSPGDMSPGLRWWMNAADEALRHSLASGAAVSTGAELRDAEYPEAVGELLKTKWDQAEPYNRRLVELSGKDLLTGCVATAMAQLMKYYNYPERGQGYKGYDIGGKHVNVIFGQKPYEWELMRDVYGRSGYTDAEANAVAELMFHCGVSVDMNYSEDGSGAMSNNAAIAMKDVFTYDTRFMQRDIYTTSEWMDIIYAELAAGRPILYGGATPQMAGHAFVFDGYDADGLVHVNWGWSGSGNGYFDVAILNSGQGNFSEQQDMILAHVPGGPLLPTSSQWGIVPELTWYTSTGQTYDTQGSFTVSLNANGLAYTASNLMNCDAYPFSGEIALLARPENGGALQKLGSTTVKDIDYYSLINNSSETYSSTADISGLPDGVYRVYLASKATAETEWQPVRSNETVVNNYLLTISGGAATVAEGDPGWTTGIENIGVSAANGDGMVRVYTADGVLVFSSKADAFSLDDVPAHGILIVKRGAETVKVAK